jgi:hypothetical protein
MRLWYEMNAVVSEFNRWNSKPMHMASGVHLRWEKTLATNRMFFDVEAELMSGRKRRSLSSDKQLKRSPKRRGVRASMSSLDRKPFGSVNYSSCSANFLSQV